RADEAEHGAADQDRQDGRGGGYLYCASDDLRHDEVVLNQAVGDVEREGGQRDRRRYGERDQADQDAPDGGPDDRDEVEDGHGDGQQDRVRHPEDGQPDEGTGAGDQRGEQVAEHESTDLGEHLVAEQDGTRAAGGRDEAVDQPPDAGEVGQQVDRQN